MGDPVHSGPPLLVGPPLMISLEVETINSWDKCLSLHSALHCITLQFSVVGLPLMPLPWSWDRWGESELQSLMQTGPYWISFTGNISKIYFQIISGISNGSGKRLTLAKISWMETWITFSNKGRERQEVYIKQSKLDHIEFMELMHKNCSKLDSYPEKKVLAHIQSTLL